MQNVHTSMIWRGRLHLGDEPGIYGDAAYTGLSTDLPLTLTKYADEAAADDVTIEIAAEGVSVFPAYEGHLVSIVGYRSLPAAGDSVPQWEEVVLTTARLTDNQLRVRVDPRKSSGLKHLSVRVRVDTSLSAGNYDDFVLLALSLRSDTHYATFGFH